MPLWRREYLLMKSQDSGSAEKKISERLKETKTGKMIVENLEPLDPEQKVVRDSKGDIFTIPNLLTMARIALVPVFVYFYVANGDYMLTAFLILLSGATDIADGYIARHFHMTSDVGKALDPIADKLTQFAIMLCLVHRFPHMIYPIVLIVIKEITSGILGLVTIKKTGQVEGAVWHGKLATVLIYATMLTHILWVNIPATVSDVMILTCCGMMLVSFALYSARYFVMLKKGGGNAEAAGDAEGADGKGTAEAAGEAGAPEDIRGTEESEKPGSPEA